MMIELRFFKRLGAQLMYSSISWQVVVIITVASGALCIKTIQNYCVAEPLAVLQSNISVGKPYSSRTSLRRYTAHWMFFYGCLDMPTLSP
jgi:hypothetical protein